MQAVEGALDISLPSSCNSDGSSSDGSTTSDGSITQGESTTDASSTVGSNSDGSTEPPGWLFKYLSKFLHYFDLISAILVNPSFPETNRECGNKRNVGKSVS